ncbi:uncharacterized protein [Nerophis lumbriciformis]|uniref:uncharacterized protein n=1 Tax=Nerophis lumbriciformis TaxID=546530 RepID=UPI002ADFB4A9|nr:uncharacterized protein si:ch211-67f24.7 [Nerophis lumbriciformis]
MKPEEAELITEISKLQGMVSELKAGFTGALLELAQIQHGDSSLREELEENKRRCQKKALRLETLVESLREEFGVMRGQVLQMCGDRQRPLQDEESTAAKETDPAGAFGGRSQPEATPAEAAWSSSVPCRGKVLLHCFLQGLKAGLTEGTDARHQVALQLLHSEWEYVSTLTALYDEYKPPPPPPTSSSREAFATCVERLLQRHLLFRNNLQERLSAEHWKSLVGDILVQLVGQNDTTFSDMYVGYTSTLASFLSLDFCTLSPPGMEQVSQVEKEQIKVLSLHLAPVTRVHCYLSHVQNLLQWTSKEHPDCSLLLGTERALRDVLSRCHAVLEEDVKWDDEEQQERCCDDTAAASSANTRSSAPHRTKGETAAQRESSLLTNGSGLRHSLRLECWSCSPVRRKTCLEHVHHPGRSLLLTPDTPGWGETSDSGLGTFSQHTGKGASELEAHRTPEDPETDADTSALDDSSGTSCSPDCTLCREALEDEEDSQVPVLLKPREHSERSVCLRWQIPRLTPHPPLRKSTRACTDMPSPLAPCGKKLVSVRKGSPPLHANRAFRPIWDDPSKQADPTPEKDRRQGFVPVRTSARQNFVAFRDNLRPGLPAQPGFSLAPSSGALWDDSEDSEGPCSTV